jgi:hypothetical protein
VCPAISWLTIKHIGGANLQNSFTNSVRFIRTTQGSGSSPLAVLLVCILLWQDRGKITLPDIIDLLSISRPTATKHLKALVLDGYLASDGGYHPRYMLGEQLEQLSMFDLQCEKLFNIPYSSSIDIINKTDLKNISLTTTTTNQCEKVFKIAGEVIRVPPDFEPSTEITEYLTAAEVWPHLIEPIAYMLQNDCELAARYFEETDNAHAVWKLTNRIEPPELSTSCTGCGQELPNGYGSKCSWIYCPTNEECETNE